MAFDCRVEVVKGVHYFWMSFDGPSSELCVELEVDKRTQLGFLHTPIHFIATLPLILSQLMSFQQEN